MAVVRTAAARAAAGLAVMRVVELRVVVAKAVARAGVEERVAVVMAVQLPQVQSLRSWSVPPPPREERLASRTYHNE